MSKGVTGEGAGVGGTCMKAGSSSISFPRGIDSIGGVLMINGCWFTDGVIDSIEDVEDDTVAGLSTNVSVETVEIRFNSKLPSLRGDERFKEFKEYKDEEDADAEEEDRSRRDLRFSKGIMGIEAMTSRSVECVDKGLVDLLVGREGAGEAGGVMNDNLLKHSENPSSFPSISKVSGNCGGGGETGDS